MRKNVALLIETSNSYARGLLEGIAQYARRHESWSIYLPERARGGKPPEWLKDWDGDGIIARIETQEIAQAVSETGVPIVDVSAGRFLPSIPWVETDDVAIAQTGVKHLVDRGFKELAFCGDPQFNWSNWRKSAFLDAVNAVGLSAHVFDTLSSTESDYSWNKEKEGLGNWLLRLPRPVGVFACYDIQAQKILDVCRDLKIAVPEEVAVLGVDNDTVLCDLADPPLSSIICNTRRSGFQAASLLDRMMTGEVVDEAPILLEPLGVQTRRSSDSLAIDDPVVAAALRFIREHACTDINVNSVVDQVDVSRRSLESRFRKVVGRTPHEEISRVKLERIKSLLVQSDLPLQQIADLSGFDHVEYMSVFFRKHLGMPPGQYRREKQS